jgi:ParB/RepB/Spo0J family partition protein
MSATAQKQEAQAMVELVALDKIAESPLNHRSERSWGNMEELTASIKVKGVLQPVLVRPLTGIGANLYELVFGARRLRASKAAGLSTIPAMVRKMTDGEVIEAQLVENLARADVHPMDEAAGYEQLMKLKDRPLSVDEIAAKVGKSKAYIYGRMKLLALCKEAREAFYDGKLTPSVALLVARIPDAALQKKALKRLEPQRDEDQLPFREAARVIHDEFMLKLAMAPFDPADATLLAKAGACSACPKRSGSQPELFEDVASADVCSDPTCYREKAEVEFGRRAAAAKAKGREVLTGKAAKEAFEDQSWVGRPSVSYRGNYVDVDSECGDDPKYRTYRTLLGKHLADAVVIARDPKGNVRELLPKAALPRLLKEAGHNFKRPSSSSSRSSSSVPGGRPSKAELAKEKEDRALRDAVEERLMLAVLEKLQKTEPDKKLWRAVVDELEMADEGLLEACFPDAHGSKLDAAFDKLSETQLRGLALALALGPSLNPYVKDRGELLKLIGVDLKKIEAEVKAQRAAAAAAPAKVGELAWRPGRGNGIQVANAPVGFYELESVSGRWRATFIPPKGARKVLLGGTGGGEADAKKACAHHHLEQLADAKLPSELTKKELKGAAVARKKGGRRG